ncbi:MAG: transaldolase family protein [Candidatus Magasanikbacteria bacterium]
MSRPKDLNTKIFLDSGDPEKTQEIKKLLGFLDGQTTNPTLVSRNPEVSERLEKGKKFSKKEILSFYKEVVEEISNIIPNGDISIEVYADRETSVEEMLKQAHKMNSWISSPHHIKLPTTQKGLEAANRFCKNGGGLNMTLCFSQVQAAAVHLATKEISSSSVFVSPFVGRLDDRNINGMKLIENTLRMYEKIDSHVSVLVASVRNMDHFLKAIQLEADIITSPYEVLKKWGQEGKPMPGDGFEYDTTSLEDIEYKNFDFSKNFKELNIEHPLTKKGMRKFSKDWNKLIDEN